MTPHPYNTPPEGWREISEAEFAKSNYFTYSATSTESRQFPIEWKGRTTYHSVTLLAYWDRTGLALVNEFWDGKVRYFAFGCAHTMREVVGADIRGHGGRVECSVCGFGHPRHDSSD